MNLSVVIPTRDRPVLLRRLLLQLCDQTASGFEVCAVDDGSVCGLDGSLSRLMAAGSSVDGTVAGWDPGYG